MHVNAGTLEVSKPAVGAPRRARQRITVSAFEYLTEGGFIPERTELIDGEIFDMAALGNAHSVATTDLAIILASHFPKPWFVRIQSTHRLNEFNAPEPDLALLRAKPIHKAKVDELPELIVEISDTTLTEDLGRKRLLYASFGVQEYWVVDLTRKHVHVFRIPNAAAVTHEEAYADESIVKLDGSLSPLVKPEVVIRVADFMPAVG